jgi:hypothetical protein
MERESVFSTPEVIGIAAAAASALGGIIVALGRSQASAATEKAQKVDLAPVREAAVVRLAQGRDATRSAADAVADSYPDLRDAARHLLEKAGETAKPAIDRLGASKLVDTEQLRSAGTAVRERVQESLVPAAVDALGNLRERVDDGLDRSQPVASSVVAATAAGADIALSKSSSAAKDTLATVGWLLAACAVMYFALFDAERREQLKSFLFGAMEQAQLLARDFQGYEEDI